jgi:hypothetical protein
MSDPKGKKELRIEVSLFECVILAKDSEINSE